MSVKPYFTKGQERPRTSPELIARRAYLMNCPYDTTQKELEAFVNKFAPVDRAEIIRDRTGLARGFAFVYLQNSEDMDRVIEYCDGRHIRDRQIRV